MGKLLDFPTPKVEGVSYWLDDSNKVTQISCIGSPVDLGIIDGIPYIDAGIEDGEIMYQFDSREDAAKFFWVCAYYLDSEQRYAADKYVGLNYDD